MPHMAVDPTLPAAATVLGLQSIVGRNVNPNLAAVISVGRLAAGAAYNVIAESAELELSVRTLDPEVRDLVERDPQTGKALLVGGTHHDIDALKNTEMELREASLEAQAASVANTRSVSAPGARVTNTALTCGGPRAGRDNRRHGGGLSRDRAHPPEDRNGCHHDRPVALVWPPRALARTVDASQGEIRIEPVHPMVDRRPAVRRPVHRAVGLARPRTCIRLGRSTPPPRQ